MSPERRARLECHTVRPLAAVATFAGTVAVGIALFTLAVDVAIA